MRLICQEQLAPGADLVEKARFLREEAGFDGLELIGREGFVLRGRLDELRAARAAGVEMPTVCPAMSSWIGDFDPDKRRAAVAELRDQLSVVAELGGLGVITPAAWAMFSRRLPPFEPPRSPQEDRAVLLESLAELAAHAEREGVLVLLEPLNRYEDHMLNTVAGALDLCETVDSPALRILADTYHMNIEERDLCDALRAAAAAGRLGAVHVSDSNRQQPGCGHVPFDAVLATLHDIGFDGPLSLECRLLGDPAEALPAVGRLLRPLVDGAARPAPLT